MQTIAYDVCKVRMALSSINTKFCTHGSSKKTYILFQNDVPLVIRHKNDYLFLEPKKSLPQNTGNPASSESSLSLSYNLFGVTGTWPFPYESLARISLQARLGFVIDIIRTQYCGVYNACSPLKANRRRQRFAVR
ncbi:hypothetical protein TNCV_4590351 [Trichonephila clavipes]|nr:hypothetical protein TNCV_4590351 [Trichonephila clavipes]